MNSRPIRIVIVDNHPLIREGVIATLGRHPDLQVVAEAGNGRDAIEACRREKPDVVLMDLRMPVMDGIAATRVLTAELPEIRVITLTCYEGGDSIHRALEAGSRGYLLKDMVRKEVVNAVRAVHEGRRYIPSEIGERLAENTGTDDLTPRERDVLELLANGHSNQEISDRLKIAHQTVKNHVKGILRKLGANDRTHAVALAVKRGYVFLD
ncbi:MAG: response regulator transcription factor [Ignavibacteriota bacterium]